MSLERQNRPTPPPDQRMGCLGTIVAFPRLTLEAFREIRAEQRQMREIKRELRLRGREFEHGCLEDLKKHTR